MAKQPTKAELTADVARLEAQVAEHRDLLAAIHTAAAAVPIGAAGTQDYLELRRAKGVLRVIKLASADPDDIRYWPKVVLERAAEPLGYEPYKEPEDAAASVVAVPVISLPLPSWTQDEDGRHWRKQLPNGRSALIIRTADGDEKGNGAVFRPSVHESATDFTLGPEFAGLLPAADWCERQSDLAIGITLGASSAAQGAVELARDCECSHRRGAHNLSRGKCAAGGCGCTRYRTGTAPAIPEPPAVVAGTVEREPAPAEATPEERLLLAIYGVSPDDPRNVRELRRHAAECNEDDHTHCLAALADEPAAVTG